MDQDVTWHRPINLTILHGTLLRSVKRDGLRGKRHFNRRLAHTCLNSCRANMKSDFCNGNPQE